VWLVDRPTSSGKRRLLPMKVKKKNGKHKVHKSKISTKQLEGVVGGARKKKATKKKTTRKVSSSYETDTTL
jgi:hypothetical protein